jgi:hypothetical protein
MQPKQENPQQPEPKKPAIEHVSEAHRLLQDLREKLDVTPELEQAIESLEMALSILAVKTGGML